MLVTSAFIFILLYKKKPAIELWWWIVLMGSHDRELNLSLQESLQEGVGCSFVYLRATGLHCDP